MKIDESIANLSRPSVARICVEVDMFKSLPASVWVVTGSNKGFFKYGV